MNQATELLIELLFNHPAFINIRSELEATAATAEDTHDARDEFRDLVHAILLRPLSGDIHEVVDTDFIADEIWDDMAHEREG